jgi:hypothetical protein
MKAKENLERILIASEVRDLTTTCINNNYTVNFNGNGEHFCIAVLEYKPSLNDIMGLILDNSQEGISTGFIFVRPKHPSFLVDRSQSRFFKNAGAYKKPNLRRRFNQNPDVLQRLVKTNNVERVINILTSQYSHNLIFFYEDHFQAVEFPFEKAHPNSYEEGEDNEYKYVTDHSAIDLTSFTVKQIALQGNHLTTIKPRILEETQNNELIDRIEDTDRILIATFDCIPMYSNLRIAV